MKGPLFVYFATFIAIGCSPLQPFIGVLVYIMFAIMSPNALWFYNLPPTFLGTPYGYSLVVAVPMLIGWIFKSLGDWNIGKAALPVCLLVIYYIWVWATSMFIGVPPRGWYTIELMFRLILAMAAALSLCGSVFRLRCIIWSIIFASGFVAYELNMSYFGGFNRLQMLGYAGMDNNFYAVALLIGTTISFYMGLAERNYVLKGLAFFAAVLQAHAIMFSMSRGGMLGLCIVGVITLILIPKTTENVVLLIVAVVLALSMAGPSVRERFATVFVKEEDLDGSAQSRLESWRNCITVIRERPVTGVGIMNWPIHAQQRFGIFLEAHSTWFQAAAETGIPGLALQLGFVLVTVWRVLPIARGTVPLQDPCMRYYGQMVVASMGGYVISAQFVSLYCMEITYYACLIGLCSMKLSHQLQQELEQQAWIEKVRQLEAEEEEGLEHQLATA